MVLLSDKIEHRAVREILRDRKSREEATATRRAVVTFIKEFLFVVFLFATIFILFGGFSR